QAQINGNFGTHTLRKTFGYHFYRQFNDIVMLQKILNHSHPAITLRYIGIEQDEINNSYHQFVL
ncbi:MAG: tyrosine-type recombinase/integrase, partial [Alphaproteobacteria bacterium]|nr:tyrosine-type recombinase/integrase [Alphaproteobacteria bacterium]